MVFPSEKLGRKQPYNKSIHYEKAIPFGGGSAVEYEANVLNANGELTVAYDITTHSRYVL